MNYQLIKYWQEVKNQKGGGFVLNVAMSGRQQLHIESVKVRDVQNAVVVVTYSPRQTTFLLHAQILPKSTQHEMNYPLIKFVQKLIVNYGGNVLFVTTNGKQKVTNVVVATVVHAVLIKLLHRQTTFLLHAQILPKSTQHEMNYPLIKYVHKLTVNYGGNVLFVTTNGKLQAENVTKEQDAQYAVKRKYQGVQSN